MAVGVFAWVGMQMIVNIAAMTGLVPLTGITLPLLSYGGTSMIFIAFAIGEVCQLSCYTSREGIKEDEDISLEIANDNNEYIEFKLIKEVEIITPGLNLILDNPYKLDIKRVVYYE